MTLLITLLAAASAALGLSSPVTRPDGPLAVGFTNTTQKHPAIIPPVQAAALARAVAPAGIERFAIQWRLAQPSPDGPINLADYERELVQPALANGLRPLIVLIAAPPWAWGDGECNQGIARTRGFCTMPPGDDEESLASWTTFVRAVAERWSDVAAGIEIWNEENAGGFWNDTDGPDTGKYADLLCTAYDAVRAVSPATPVIMGGLATAFETDTTHTSAPDYLAALYHDPDRDVRDCMTGIGVHPYPSQEAPNTVGSPFLAKLANIREVRDAEDPGRPLWITEFGYWTGGPSGITPVQQALELGCAVRMAAGMPDVDALVIHDLVDRGPPNTAEGTFGVYARSPTGGVAPKPAALALRLVLGDGPGAIQPTSTC